MIPKVAEEVSTHFECLIIKLILERTTSLQETRPNIVQQLTV